MPQSGGEVPCRVLVHEGADAIMPQSGGEEPSALGTHRPVTESWPPVCDPGLAPSPRTSLRCRPGKGRRTAPRISRVERPWATPRTPPSAPTQPAVTHQRRAPDGIALDWTRANRVAWGVWRALPGPM